MVDPARAPTPTDSCCCASSPIPEKRTIAPSGTAPKTGRTTDPTMPAKDGTSSRSSDPSEIMLDALEQGQQPTRNHFRRCTHLLALGRLGRHLSNEEEQHWGGNLLFGVNCFMCGEWGVGSGDASEAHLTKPCLFGDKKKTVVILRTWCKLGINRLCTYRSIYLYLTWSTTSHLKRIYPYTPIRLQTCTKPCQSSGKVSGSMKMEVILEKCVVSSQNVVTTPAHSHRSCNNEHSCQYYVHRDTFGSKLHMS